jgi:hypothetical protein
MSGLGQKRTLKRVHLMSALPPKADIGSTCQDVRFVPIADSRTAAKVPLFDHLVGKRNESWRDFKAKRLGGLKIEHEFELGRLHYR